MDPFRISVREIDFVSNSFREELLNCFFRQWRKRRFRKGNSVSANSPLKKACGGAVMGEGGGGADATRLLRFSDKNVRCATSKKANANFPPTTESYSPDFAHFPPLSRVSIGFTSAVGTLKKDELLA